MKRFKEYIKTTPSKPLKYGKMTNGHGSHALEKEYGKMTNGHGSHALEYPITPTVKEAEGSFLEKNREFLGSKLNKSLGEGTEEDHMAKLESDHPIANPAALQQLKHYTADSKDVNMGLIEGDGKLTKLTPTARKRVKAIDSAMVPSKHDLQLHHGANFDLKTLKPSGVSPEGHTTYRIPAFLSASHDQRVARTFSLTGKARHDNPHNQLLHFYIKKGQPIAPIGSISYSPRENETILPRTKGTAEKYHLEHFATTQHTDSQGNTFQNHHVRLIPESSVSKP